MTHSWPNLVEKAERLARWRLGSDPAQRRQPASPPPQATPQSPTEVHSAEGGAATARPTVSTPMGALLGGHILRDGELVLLILRPSRWFILLTCYRSLAAIIALTVLAAVLDDRFAYAGHQWAMVGVIVAMGRLTWSVLQWMSRLYILTDLRIIRLSGVFSVDIYDCALRKVARAMLEATPKERLCRIGSITIIPHDDQCPLGSWQMVPRPRDVHEQVARTIARAKGR